MDLKGHRIFIGAEMSHKDCRCEHVASSPVGHVSLCPGCGQVHLTMQYMTVRFERGAFRALAAMIGEAQQRMDCATSEASSLPVASATSHVH